MGTGIAAFFADRQIPVTLYDVSVDLAKKAIEKAADPSNKVPILMSGRAAALITPRSVEDYAGNLDQCDIIVEAVPEILSLKKKVYDAIERFRKPGSLVCTNTSGLSVDAMAEGRSEDFRKNFLGTHFFNPVRFMQLIEVIPGKDTSPDVVQNVMMQLKMMGKKPVLAKDTPNFIANRIGIYGMMKTLKLMQKYGFSVEDIDAITGEPLGNAKSATFRTADLVGIDTLAHVAQNALENAKTEDEKQTFAAPAWLKTMLEKKMLGDKTGGGFYKKTGGGKGGDDDAPKAKSEILTLDVEKLEYRKKIDARHDAIRVAKGYSKPADRVVATLTYGDEDKVSQFARELVLSLGAYALSLTGEIADDARAIDEAVKLGFGKDVGPIEALDALGAARAKKMMERIGVPVPAVLAAAAAENASLLPKAEENGTISLSRLRSAPGKVVRENLNARLVDLGDQVLLCELDAKMVPSM
ncbi:MAG TPA: 3-hydroxyacyl-CoA dehydrogenase family protein, partial [Planctomycetota bacterium]|nr:3-hydroxyacyl-CoA dehydrogenase family protein [Planctomycetota bacterium]